MTSFSEQPIYVTYSQRLLTVIILSFLYRDQNSLQRRTYRNAPSEVVSAACDQRAERMIIDLKVNLCLAQEEDGAGSFSSTQKQYVYDSKNHTYLKIQRQTILSLTSNSENFTKQSEKIRQGAIERKATRSKRHHKGSGHTWCVSSTRHFFPSYFRQLYSSYLFLRTKLLGINIYTFPLVIIKPVSHCVHSVVVSFLRIPSPHLLTS